MKPLQIENQHVLVFVPGFKGTSLVDPAQNEKVWLRLGELLFGNATLAWDKEGIAIPGARELVPEEVLTELSVLPLLYTYDIYGSCLTTLRDSLPENFRFITFPYDWRRDNVETAEMLISALREIRAGRPRSVTLLAHSMGGLMTAYMLRYGGQQASDAEESWEGARLLDKVILAGVPFEGTMLMLRDMQTGVRQGLNRDLLSSAALSSFPSSYQLLPYRMALVRDLSSESEAWLDVFEYTKWAAHNWGLLAENISASSAPVETGAHQTGDYRELRKSFVRRHLGRAERFFERVHAVSTRLPTRKIPLLNVIGAGTPTLYRGAVTESGTLVFETGSIESDRKDSNGAATPLTLPRFFDDGDGVVSRTSAEIPEPFSAAFDIENIETDASHGRLCVENRANKRIRDFILQ